MEKVPFNVSARTARLIGRENVSSAEGALIELVKNSYDADAKFCIVFFEDAYAEIPQKIDPKKLNDLCFRLGELKLKDCFQRDLFDDELRFSQELYNKLYLKNERNALEEKLANTVVIHIMDNGDGMLEETIKTSWMTIGTDNKHLNFRSEASGRIKSGAKGIGRFALDRLGEHCNLLTKTAEEQDALRWRVDWGDFDSQGLTIDEVNAELGKSAITLKENFVTVLGSEIAASELFCNVNKGTHIQISHVRDRWAFEDVEKIFRELESLVPASDTSDFSVYLFSQRHKDRFGIIEPSICDDYDYKLTADMGEDGVCHIAISRNEIDPEKIPDTLLRRKFFREDRYRYERLFKEPYEYKRTFAQLVPGLIDLDEDAHKAIGSFRLVFYFLKRVSDSVDTATFLHRSFDSASRKRWLNNNSGIRIYRDNFRVRPYGEIGKSSWDWLGLGRRQADDPSALRSGRWKVPPSNISGIIKISRLNNLGLEDKSSREGILENDAFALFRSVIESLVKEFEQDRGGLYKEIYKDFLSRKKTPTDDELKPSEEIDAEKIAQKIFDELKKENKTVEQDKDKLALALLKEKARGREIDDRLEDMKKENSLLRVFASSGITIAAFTHELDSLNAKLGGRFEQLEKVFTQYLELSGTSRELVPDHKNPFRRIEILKRDDERVKNWIKYSLRSIRKDKRNRKVVSLKPYLENLRDEWNSTLLERQVYLDVAAGTEDLSIKCFEIDLDCIFNNLIINSIDAFKRRGFAGERRIRIHAGSITGGVSFTYRDSGPGLSESILNPMDIFIPTFTTKKNKHGVDVGTGMGMWLVKSTLEEYSGKAELLNENGFSMRMEMKK